MSTPNPSHSFVSVEATSVADYLDRYYKKDRLASVDNAYGTGHLLKLYEIDYECFGFVCTSHYDNITGENICWPYYTLEYGTQEQWDVREERRAEFFGGVESKPHPHKVTVKMADDDLDIFD